MADDVNWGDAPMAELPVVKIDSKKLKAFLVFSKDNRIFVIVSDLIYFGGPLN